MSTLNAVPVSQAVREAIAQQYQTASTQAAEGPTLVVKDDVYADKARGILLRSKWKDGLEVVIQPWGNPFFSAVLYIDKKTGTGGWEPVHTETLPGGALNQEYPVLIDAGNLPANGAVQLRGAINIGGSNRYDGAETLVILDSTAPYGNKTPTSPDKPSLDEVVVTEPYLDANGGAVGASLPDYDDYDAGDRAYVYLEKTLPQPGHPPLTPIWQGAASQGGTAFKLDENALRGKPDGEYYLIYLLVDVAGNVSDYSYTEKIDLLLSPLPSSLAAPEVPAANPTIDLGNIRNRDVAVHVLPYDGFQVTDWVEPLWDGAGLAEHPVPPSGHTIIPVDSASFEPLAGQQTTAQVAYTVRRLRWESGESPVTTVPIDLRVPGPENPGWPGPNPDLLPLTFTSDSGAKNQITLADIGKPGTLAFEIYEEAKPGQTIEFFWDGKKIAGDYAVQAGDTPGDSKTRSVPWEDQFLSVGNAQAQVHYRVVDPALPVANYQEAKPTAVDTSAIPLALPPMSFPDLMDQGGWLIYYCNNLKDRDNPGGGAPTDPGKAHMRVAVPDLSVAPFNLSAGDTLNLHWKTFLYDDVPGLPDKPVRPIEEDGEYTETHVLSAGEEKGFFWYIPYEPYGRVTAYPDVPYDPSPTAPWAWVQVHYTTEINNTPAASAPTENVITNLHMLSAGCYAETPLLFIEK